MKKLLFKSLLIMGAMLAAVTGLTSCGGGGDDEPEPATLTVSNSSLSTDANGGSMSFQVTSNTTWSISGYPSWISVSPSTGKSGTTSVSITVASNTSVDDRTCTLLVSTTDGSMWQTVSIVQSGIQASLSVSPSVNVGSEKGAQNTFAISSNTAWTLSGVPSWLSATPLNGSGNATVTLTTLSANETAEERTANLMVTAGGQTATIVVTQANGLSSAKVVPTDMVALYDQICFEFEGTGNPHKFYYDIYSQSELQYKSDLDIIEELEKGTECTFEEGWIAFPSGFSSNTTYYVCSIAYDQANNRGALVKSPITTRAYTDYNNDAYASLNMSWYDDDHNYVAYTFTRQAYCDKYHVIYGTNLSSTVAKRNRVLYAFQINYYLQHGTKHWFSNKWNLTIQTNYPNDHSFICPFDWTSSYGAIVAYSWGIFQNGNLSSDMIGGYADLYSSSSTAKKIASSKSSSLGKSGIIKEYTTLSKESQLKARLAKRK